MPELAGAEVSTRELREMQSAHNGLRAEIRTRGIWPFRVKEYEVLCSCNWRDPEKIPLMPVEVGLTQAFLIRTSCERHLLDELNKLRQRRRRRWPRRRK